MKRFNPKEYIIEQLVNYDPPKTHGDMNEAETPILDFVPRSVELKNILEDTLNG